MQISRITIITAIHALEPRVVTKIIRLLKAPVAEVKITARQEVHQAPDKPTAQAQHIQADQVLLPVEFQAQATVLHRIQARAIARHPEVHPAQVAVTVADHPEAAQAAAAVVVVAEAAVEAEDNFCFNHLVTLT